MNGGEGRPADQDAGAVEYDDLQLGRARAENLRRHVPGGGCDRVAERQPVGSGEREGLRPPC